jgi:hypothetical protein
MAIDTIGCRNDVIRRLGYGSDAEEGLSIMAGGAAGDDPAVIHAGIWAEGHSASMAGLASWNRGWDVIGGPARRNRSIVAGHTGTGRSLQTAIDVAALAGHKGVRASQRKTGLEVVEFGGALLRKPGASKKQQCQGKNASEQNVLSHRPLALRRSASVEAERAQKDGGKPSGVLCKP